MEAALVKGDLDGARASLSMIVGRETSHLSLEDMRRAVIETVAENLADGVVAPMFFTLTAGPAGAVFLQGRQHHGQHGGLQKLLVCPVRQGGGPGRRRPQLHPGPPHGPPDDSHGRGPRAWIGGGPGASSGGTGATPPAPTPAVPKPPWPGPWGCAWGVPASISAAWWKNPLSARPGQPLDQERYRQAIRLLYGTSLAMAAITLVGLLAGRAGVWGLLSLIR